MTNLKGYVFWEKNGGYSHKVMDTTLDEAVNKLGITHYIDYKVYDLWQIVDLETGMIHESFWNYDDAEYKLDYYSEKYPMAALDIVGPEDE